MQTTANTDQETYWNSAAGQRWVTEQETMDALLGDVLARLLERAQPSAGERVLDVGCGTGDSSLKVATAVGAEGRVTGVDISETLLAHARHRLATAGTDRVSFLRADAQTHAFDAASVDLIMSRFGVMFFADPVAAFANMRRALRPGGRVSFVSWSRIEENPWFLLPRDAAIAKLGRPAPTDPRAPGPLAFAEIDYVTGILGDAGYKDIAGEAETVHLDYPGGLDGVSSLASRIGPAVRIVNELGGTEEDLAAISDTLAKSFAPYASNGGLRVPGRFNFFSAVAS